MFDSAEQLRKVFGEADTVRDRGLKSPDDIIRYTDILYGRDEKWNLLDVYRPVSLPEKRPCKTIVSIHGGGWVYGDKERYKYYAMYLAQQGFYGLLRERGVKAVLKEYKDEKPLGHVFHLDIRNSAAQICNKKECEYLNSIGGSENEILCV